MLCQNCNKEWDDKDELIKHIKTDHNTESAIKQDDILKKVNDVEITNKSSEGWTFFLVTTVRKLFRKYVL